MVRKQTYPKEQHQNSTATAAVRFATLAGLVVLLLFPIPTRVFTQKCPSPRPTLQQTVTSYVQNRYGNPGANDLLITDISFIGSTCYRKITWESSSRNRKITLYLTPDEKYLTTMLMDLSENLHVATPRAGEVSTGAQAPPKAEPVTMNALLAGSPPFRGPTHAPVTIVEFVDFQCPDCRHFAERMAELPAEETSMIRVVLHQHPFSFHAWARKAAAMSICVDREDHGAFWKLSDFIYAHQGELTEENFDPRLLPFVKDDLHLDPETVKSCIDKNGYETALIKDRELARQFNIRATPTVFVNGRKFIGFRSTGDLRKAIDAAYNDAPSNPAPSPIIVKQ